VWTSKFLISKKKPQFTKNPETGEISESHIGEPTKHSFNSNLKFMLKVLQQPPQPFEVTLRLWNCSKLISIREIGQFTISLEVNLEANIDGKVDNKFEKFIKTPSSGCFAKTKVDAFDFLSAANIARETFENLMDFVRFEFEPNAINIDPSCYIKRLVDSKIAIFPISRGTPNPTPFISQEELLSFVKDIDTISKKTDLDINSISQIQSAIRQYRFGHDSDNFKDKFLYWWLGLEPISRFDEGDIGITVNNNISHLMAITYLNKLLTDLLSTLKHYEKSLPPELTAIYGADLKTLTTSQLLNILLDPAQKQHLLKHIRDYPVLSFNCQNIAENIADPKKTASYIEEHLKHVRWHLFRLYRIRCCIVHGSPIIFRLQLFSANLEYYLKQSILICIDTFKNNSHIPTLEEFFLRAITKYELLLSHLNEEHATNDVIYKVVVSDVLLEREKL
jgi:hypothetical protein